jgi:MOSC domain-containing protein YiiM
MQVEAIYIADEGSAPMGRVDGVEAVADRGLRGDRYFARTGYYSPYDVCQVTFVAREAIAAIDEEYGLDLSAGEHRRNVVTSGVDLDRLLDARFRIGGAVFEGTRPRPPCHHVEEVNRERHDTAGVARALQEGRGGICADVRTTGRIRAGDEITDVSQLDRTDEIVERLRNEAVE